MQNINNTRLYTWALVAQDAAWDAALAAAEDAAMASWWGEEME